MAAGGWTGTGEEIGDTFPTSRIDFYDFETGICISGQFLVKVAQLLCGMPDFFTVFLGDEYEHL